MATSDNKPQKKPLVTKSVTSEGSRGPLWIVILILLAGGIYANYHYTNVAWAIRAAVAIVLICACLLISVQTSQGKAAWAFVKGSRAELRKVVWPTRQETIQTTIIVAIMVVITALILWGLDSVFVSLVGWITGQ